MGHTGFVPAHGGLCFPSLHCSGSRLFCRGIVRSGPCISCTFQVWAAQVQVRGHSTKAQNQFGVHFVPFPGSSSSGDQVLGKHTVPGVPYVLITSPVPTTWFLGYTVRALSQVCYVSLLGSGSHPLSLLADVNHSGSQENLATGSLLTVWWRMLVSGAKISPCLLLLSVVCFPASGGCWGGWWLYAVG